MPVVSGEILSEESGDLEYRSLTQFVDTEHAVTARQNWQLALATDNFFRHWQQRTALWT